MSLARRADKYECYQRSVQEPDADVPFIERVFRKERGRAPRSLREDFCGTAAFACAWVKHHRENTAFGIDLDPEPLEWGRKHNASELDPEQAARLKLIEGDVRVVGHEAVDVTCAFNFSYFVLKERAQLLAYFRRVRGHLARPGLFLLDAYGGSDAMRTMVESREVEGFDYVWDQHLFDPIQHHAVNYIHFEFPDGSELKRAFKYDWRLWTLPEIRDVLLEAGFAEVDFYWEGTDAKTNEGNGIYRLARSAPDDPAWVSYIAAWR